MNEYAVNSSKLELTRGDIIQQADCDAIVNAANAQLRIGGGVAGAIHRAAGPALEVETRPLAPIKPGEAVITGGHNLPNDYIIHCLGPVYGRDKPADKLLADCYRNALDVMRNNGLYAIAFPAISTGAFGYPMEEAARVALGTVTEELKQSDYTLMVRFVLWSEQAYKIHQKVAEELLS